MILIKYYYNYNIYDIKLNSYKYHFKTKEKMIQMILIKNYYKYTKQ